MNFTYFGVETSTVQLQHVYNQVVAYYLLVIGALLGLGLTIAGIWWGYQQLLRLFYASRGWKAVPKKHWHLMPPEGPL